MDEMCYHLMQEYNKYANSKRYGTDGAVYRPAPLQPCPVPVKDKARDAVWWKDACLLYFQTYSGMPIPYDIERPVHELEELKRYNWT